MLNTLGGGSNIVLYGPRRYGKSSLVGELLNDLRRRGTACAELNLMDIASLDDFIAKFARAVYRELAPMSDALNQVARLFKRITPTVGIDNEGKPELKFTITSAKAGIEALRDVLELPAKLCAKDCWRNPPSNTTPAPTGSPIRSCPITSRNKHNHSTPLPRHRSHRLAGGLQPTMKAFPASSTPGSAFSTKNLIRQLCQHNFTASH